jgi:hypothetical protein
MPFVPPPAAFAWPDTNNVVFVQDQMVYLVSELSWQRHECGLVVLAAVGSCEPRRLHPPKNLISKLVLVNVIGDKYLFVRPRLVKESFTMGLDESAAFRFLEGAILGVVVIEKIQQAIRWSYIRVADSRQSRRKGGAHA